MGSKYFLFLLCMNASKNSAHKTKTIKMPDIGDAFLKKHKLQKPQQQQMKTNLQEEDKEMAS